MDLRSAVWRKSTFSEQNGCVEVALLNNRVAVRDSKDPRGPVLLFSPAEWEAFVAGVLAGEFSVS